MTDLSYFARWTVPQIRPVRDSETYQKQAEPSASLHHPEADQASADAADGSRIAGFQSICWEQSTARANKKQKTSAQQKEFLCNAGGTVWSLDWCPITSGGTDTEYLMVGCHPAGHTRSVIGEVIQKPAMLQLWSVPGASGSSSSDRQRPLMEMGICHQGGLTWDCKWCPHDASMQVPASPVNQSSSENLPRLGLLAAVLGNGDINVLAVPAPSAARERLESADAAPEDAAETTVPFLVEVPPVAWLASGCLGNSLPCTVEWLPAAPHDLLLVGCWDGTVAVIRVQPSAAMSKGQGAQESSTHQTQPDRAMQHDMVVLTHFQADPLPVRAVAWCPTQVEAEGGVEQRHLFLTAGHLGSLRLWDSRDPSKPIYQRRISSISRLLTVEWSSLLDPPGLLVGADDGSLVYEATHPQEEGQTWQEAHLWRQEADKGGHGTRSVHREFRGTNSGAIWSVHCCPSNGMVAYSGEAGEVAVFKERMLQDNRMRRAHTAVAGIQVLPDGSSLELRSAGYYTRHMSGLYTGSKPGKGKGLPHERQTVNKVRWSPNGGEAAWLAHGGASGIVWLQHLSLR